MSTSPEMIPLSASRSDRARLFLIATWVAVCPLSLGLSYLLDCVPNLGDYDRALRAILATTLFVPAMEFVVLPGLRRLLPR